MTILYMIRSSTLHRISHKSSFPIVLLPSSTTPGRMFSAATESLTQVDIAIFVPQYFSVIDTSFLSQTISLWLKTFSESTVMT